MLSVDGIGKRFGSVVAIRDCSFSVGRGSMLGFLGPNGAGKTTAMRIILGLVDPDVGTARWDGHPIDGRVRLRIGYMPEERGLYPRMELHEQLVYHGRLHGMRKAAARAEADRLLELLGLADRHGAKIDELSHGNQQRAQLAVALIHDPELLVLDEPFAGLDPIGVDALAEVLEERVNAGCAVLFSSHQLDLVEDLCREVVIINAGAIVLAGDVDALRRSAPRRYLDVVVDGGDVSWLDGVHGARLVSQTGDRVRVGLDDTARIAAIAESAERAGQIREFSYAPPDLSEVFRDAVGAAHE